MRRKTLVLFGILLALAGNWAAFLTSTFGQDPKMQIAFTSSKRGDKKLASDIYIMDADGTHLRQLTDFPGWDAGPAWSPDGRKIAFSSDRDRVFGGIYLMDPDGKNVQLLLNDGNVPAWSPDGQQIAFSLELDIYVMDADGSNVRQLTDDPAPDSEPAWSPDGRRIAFSAQHKGNNRGQKIYVMDVNGRNVRRLTQLQRGYEANPSWSPDGRQIAFAYWDGNPGTETDLYVMDIDGKNLRKIADKAGSAAWSPDGHRIAFTSYRDGNAEIYVMDVDGRNLHNLTNRPDYHDGGPSWAPFVPQAVSPFGLRPYLWGQLKRFEK